MIQMPGKGDALDRATILLLKLEHALSRDQSDKRTAVWLEELRYCLNASTGISGDEFGRVYRLNRKIWEAEDTLQKAAVRMSNSPEDLIELGRLALSVRLWNIDRSSIIATYNKFQDKV